MQTYALVRTEHLNHYGSLFGGHLLKWVDEVAWLAAAQEFPGAHLVTRAMHRVSFERSVHNGSILRFVIDRKELGTTSATYTVTVYARVPESEELIVFDTSVTFVSVGEDGQKMPLPTPVQGE